MVETTILPYFFGANVWVKKSPNLSKTLVDSLAFCKVDYTGGRWFMWFGGHGGLVVQFDPGIFKT